MKNSRIRRIIKSVQNPRVIDVKGRHTWKKASCFTFDQKNGCFNAVLAFGLRNDQNSYINVLLTMYQKLLVKKLRQKEMKSGVWKGWNDANCKFR